MTIKIFFLASSLFLLFTNIALAETSKQTENQDIITSDIDNFWATYDKIILSKDNTQQLELLNKMFIEKGSDGLKKIMQARRYTPQEYVDAINRYPQFWNSIRANTYKSRQLSNELQNGIEQLRKIYPNLKPAKIYFTIGVFRTGGTTLDGSVLIGSEMAMADETTVMDEFPESFNYFKNFAKTNPIKNIGFGNVHEYVHTQQKTTIGDNLLAQSVLEGVAEFLAVKATDTSSTAPAISFGKQNFEQVRSKFATQMFNSFNGFWLYDNAENEFKMRDLGYYVGYEICERYYNKAVDKNRAVKEMIELDYNNEIELMKFVDRSGYFAKSSKSLKKAFENKRPKVTAITQFKNGSKNVNPNIKELTINFSDKMDTRYRNFELGPLGENNLLRLKRFIGYSADGKSATFEIELKSNQRYQRIVGLQFRDENGVSLKPYLIDFTTDNQNK